MDSELVLRDNGTENWRDKRGRLHREDGPAVVFPFGGPFGGRVLWFIGGIRYRTFSEWCLDANPTEQEKMLLVLKYG